MKACFETSRIPGGVAIDSTHSRSSQIRWILQATTYVFSIYLLLPLAHGTENSGDAGDYSRAITVNQRRRSDLVHIPDVDLPDNGFPIIHFHGTDDPLPPPTPEGVASTPFDSVQHSIDCRVRANGCHTELCVTVPGIG